MNDPDADSSLRGALGKLREYPGRFALVLALIWEAAHRRYGAAGGRDGIDRRRQDESWPVPEVTAEDVELAWRLTHYFKAMTHRVRHEAAGGGVGNRDTRAVLGWIRRNGRLTFREADVASDLRRFRAHPRDLADALAGLLAAGAIRPKPDQRPRGVGRTGTTVYEVNPELYGAPGNTGNDPEPAVEAAIRGISGIPGRVLNSGSEVSNGREVIVL